MKPFVALASIMLAAFLCSCNDEHDKKEYESAVPLSDTTSITGLSSKDIKLVKTAAINFKVKNVEQSARSVSALAQKFGGMIFNQSLHSAENNRKEIKLSADSIMVISSISPHAEITARVPAENLESFMFSVTDLGYFTESNTLNIDDKSLTFLENVLKQKNRNEVLSASTAKKTMAASGKAIEIKDEITDRKISNLSINADAKYSTVALNLFQNPLVQKEVIANYVIADYELPATTRFMNAVKDGWQFFLSFLLVLAHAWAFILTGVIIYFSYRYNQQRKKLFVFKG
jgi:hypothetical protein